MNLQRIVQEIIKSGLSEGQIANELWLRWSVEVTQPTIHRIKTGTSTNPRYATGAALKELHQERCGDGKAA